MSIFQDVFFHFKISFADIIIFFLIIQIFKEVYFFVDLTYRINIFSSEKFLIFSEVNDQSNKYKYYNLRLIFFNYCLKILEFEIYPKL